LKCQKNGVKNKKQKKLKINEGLESRKPLREIVFLG
jgi:hypothetical protein